MKLKTKLATLAGALILAGLSFAGQDFVCPSIDAIKAEGLTMAEEIIQNRYITYNISTYNTDANWGFLIAPVEADSEETALATGNEILSTMTSVGVPTEENGTMYCAYETGQQTLLAAAFKDENLMSPMKLKSLYNSIH